MIAPATPVRTDRFAALQLVDAEARAHESLLLCLCLHEPEAADRLEARLRRYLADNYTPGTAAHETAVLELSTLAHARRRAVESKTDLAEFIRDLRAGQAAGASTATTRTEGTRE